MLGGQAAINHNVEGYLASQQLNVIRIDGNNRFETAANINEHAGTNQGPKAIIVNGYTVADALSASSNSTIEGIPIYLATKTNVPIMPPDTIKEVVIYGGEAVIGQEVFNQLTKKGIKVTRISGNTRFATNIKSLSSKRDENVIMVRGTSVSNNKEDYPDAVAASGLAKVLNANIILTHPTKHVPDITQHFLYNRYMNIFVLGGENAVTSDIVLETTAYVDTDLRYYFEETIVDSVIHPKKPIIYYTTKEDQNVWTLNYETGEYDWITFKEKPESLYFENNTLYVALLKGEHDCCWWDEEQEGAIAVINGDSFTLTKQFDTSLDPFDLVVNDKGYVYVAGGSGQWTKLKSFDAQSGTEISSTIIRQQSFIELHPNQNTIYAIDTDSSPRDIQSFTFDYGHFVKRYDSPYHGDYDLGNFSYLTQIKISPDGKYVFNNTGHIFQAPSLEFYKQLRYDYDDITFDQANNLFYAGRNGLILSYSYNTFEIVGALSAFGEIKKVHQNNEALVILSNVYDPEFESDVFALEVIQKNGSELSENPQLSSLSKEPIKK